MRRLCVKGRTWHKTTVRYCNEQEGLMPPIIVLIWGARLSAICTVVKEVRRINAGSIA
jgi:hypothetical protein